MTTQAQGTSPPPALAAKSMFDPAAGPWIVVLAVAALSIGLADEFPWLVRFPDGWTLPVTAWINVAMGWFVATFRWFFRVLSWLLTWPMVGLRDLLLWLPWSAAIVLAALVAYAARGVGLAFFVIVAFGYVGWAGYWPHTMRTLALVGLSVPLSVGLGFALGVAGHASRRVRTVLDPTLDVMQTVPTFAYLIPILLLFGFGPVVGLVASAIYAIPPMVRNVLLGLERVPREQIEAGIMAGCGRGQLFWLVKAPAALRQVMIGVNQTIMAALSMVIIASVIGGFNDIGWEVLSTMRRAQLGQSLLAGLVIALIAMMADRVSRGFAERPPMDPALRSAPFWRRHPILMSTPAVALALVVLAQSVPALAEFPRAWQPDLATPINDAVDRVVANYSWLMEAIKAGTLSYLMLPLRIGLENAVHPVTWGFVMTPLVSGVYAAIAAIFTMAACLTLGWRWGVGMALLSAIYYWGASHLPWSVYIAVIGTIAWQVGGWRSALLAILALSFMLVTGVWERATRTLYLTVAAVLVSFTLGSALGIWAAHSARVSAILRPINDTLQTMPPFVYLIPVVMLFQVGELSALIAIVAYATVPAIRYMEHGLRNVDPAVVEAGRAMGCGGWQLLWQVKMPQAAPVIMLGLNQTIMMALAMLVIAALVGTRDLGQLVFQGLTSADMGLGVVAGGSIALIAIVAGRILGDWSAKRSRALGMG